MNKKSIVVVGGGITGLSAAYILKKAIKTHNHPYEVTLLEASDQLGGKIKTIQKEGFTIEKGPDSLLARKKPGMKLIEELGLENQLVRNNTGQAYVLLQNKLHPIPAGSYMGIPVQMEPFLESGLVSEAGKERALKEVTLSKRDSVADQSLGAFFRGRFGDELVENLLEPLLSGIYSGDIDNMSLMATFPNFYQLEQEYGSLLKGLSDTLPPSQASTGKKRGQFVALENGLETMVEALEAEIGAETYKLGAELAQVKHTGEKYELQLQDGDWYEADSVIMTTPHKELPSIFAGYDFFQVLSEIPVTSVANVALGFDASALEDNLQGTGFVVSRNSDFRITACTWTYKKWPQTTPDGKVLLRAYVGKPSDQGIVDLSDDEIIEIVLKELGQIMNLQGTPEVSIVTRWKEAMPQYTVGHQERLERLWKEMHYALPGVFLAGSSYGGVGIPDCIEQGENTVQEVLQFLNK